MARVSLNQVAPDFCLVDYRNRPVGLADFRGKKNVLLVFNRTFADRSAERTWRSCAKITLSSSPEISRLW